MGDETARYLHALFSDSFKREIDADEAIWRSLPFFAAMIALVVAVLPAIYRSTFGIGSVVWHRTALGFLAASLISYGIAGYWLWNVIKPRQYRYPPSDKAVLDFAEKLDKYHRVETDDLVRDRKVRDELRAFMLESLSEATTNNAQNNQAKTAARTQVLLFVMAGFALAFTTEGIILLSMMVSSAAL